MINPEARFWRNFCCWIVLLFLAVVVIGCVLNNPTVWTEIACVLCVLLGMLQAGIREWYLRR